MLVLYSVSRLIFTSGPIWVTCMSFYALNIHIIIHNLNHCNGCENKLWMVSQSMLDHNGQFRWPLFITEVLHVISYDQESTVLIDTIPWPEIFDRVRWIHCVLDLIWVHSESYHLTLMKIVVFRLVYVTPWCPCACVLHCTHIYIAVQQTIFGTSIFRNRYWFWIPGSCFPIIFHLYLTGTTFDDFQLFFSNVQWNQNDIDKLYIFICCKQNVHTCAVLHIISWKTLCGADTYCLFADMNTVFISVKRLYWRIKIDTWFLILFQLKICLRGEAGGVESNRGVFVMYNGARLATLERHFQEAVQQGKANN